MQKGSCRCLVCPRLQLVSECRRRFTYAFVALLIATSTGRAFGKAPRSKPRVAVLAQRSALRVPRACSRAPWPPLGLVCGRQLAAPMARTCAHSVAIIGAPSMQAPTWRPQTLQCPLAGRNASAPNFHWRPFVCSHIRNPVPLARARFLSRVCLLCAMQMYIAALNLHTVQLGRTCFLRSFIRY